MPTAAARPTPLIKALNLLHEQRGLVYPVLAMSLILVILVPLPTPILDLLLIANIAFSAVVLLTVMYINGPLEFSSFPSLLLSLTLLRLVLNTATTRLILTNADGTTGAAGKVIEEFAGFVAAGSLAVGVIIFLIITIIQFVVITKGATRIAEVAARFTLDAMPGKQMAIDADLSAGLINEDEARRRRENITREADFYGAMDGASKFVRGDTIAGIIITLINILGGLYVGIVEKDLPITQCLEVFTKLTIGDGLSAQIPAFLVSIAAGMIVTRSTARTNMGEELISQVTSRPVAMMLSGGFLLVLMFTPLPTTPLMLMAGGVGGLGYLLLGQTKRKETEAVHAKAAKPKEPEKIETCLTVDALELEVGYGLIRLVDKKQGGDLLDRVTNIRRQIASDMGLIVPPIRIRDNVQLEPNQYSVKLRGASIARGDLIPGRLLAIDSGAVSEMVHGIETNEPAFGLPALWIAEDDRSTAEHRNYTVVEPSSVLATHLTEIIRKHAAELLTRQDVTRLLDHLKEKSPKLVEEIVPDQLKIGEIQSVLQNLLRERVPIRDLETILETLGDWAGRTKDAEILTEYVRNALARTLCEQYRDSDNTIHGVTLDPSLEELIAGHVERTDRGSYLTVPPALANRIVAAVRNEVDAAAARASGKPPVVFTSPQVRQWVRRLVESALPTVAVLGYGEVVRGVNIRTHGMVALDLPVDGQGKGMTDGSENVSSPVNV
ncbi:MAG: flagellar biosynthesis protein FlhA [Planctomycetia bacterium]|nr:flagellar biosynthesis protein FlhA [Planctomycetia bacterium]MCC7314924.1 flagellar biosynthesis protein FlhA [Planctomycetota bacterium]OQZ05859.1 MAG: flagellar biosynthesis protein FlhA [Planctomycetes bacterium UTPLA1]